MSYGDHAYDNMHNIFILHNCINMNILILKLFILDYVVLYIAAFREYIILFITFVNNVLDSCIYTFLEMELFTGFQSSDVAFLILL